MELGKNYDHYNTEIAKTLNKQEEEVNFCENLASLNVETMAKPSENIRND